MKFTDLPKNKQLLIFMVCREAVLDYENVFTIAENADELIARGIVKNKHSLSTMLYNLAVKGYVKNVANGWQITELGKNEAKYWLRQCDDAEMQETTSSDDGNDANASNWCDVVDQFAKMANAYAKMACDIASGNLQTDASDDAYASETENLKSEIEDLKTENASMHDRNIAMQRRLAQALVEIDAKNKRIAHLEDSLSKVNATFSQLQTWVTAMKNGAN